MGIHEELIKDIKKNETPIDVITKDERLQNILAFIVFFLLAFIPRLWFLFMVSTPDNPGAGWFGDAYHHWQIAYLTREIGLGHGFLRLWDLKGMEFFWGLLHPVFTMLSFIVTGSVSIAAERGMTAFMGSISVGLVYLLVSRYWNKQTAVAASVLAALNPVGVFNDVSGMVEPIGIPFLLLGIYLWPKKPFASGLILAIAIMTRAEYWVFAIGLIIAMVIIDRKASSSKKGSLILGFAFLAIIYMKYLLDKTGNPIYPFYENYMANIFGNWQFKTEFTAADIAAKHLFQAIFAVSAILSGLVLWKKPKGSLIYLLGFGNWLFLGASIGLGAYIGSYADYVWYVRFMILPYIFVGIVVSVFLFYYLPKIKVGKFLDKIKFNWVALILILVFSQSVWKLIMNRYAATEITWKNSVKIAGEIMKTYKGGGMVFLEGNPEFTYAMVKVYGFDGKNLVSEMFDPYFYFSDDPYSDWGDKREIVFKWLKDNKIRSIVTYLGTERYAKLAEKEPEYIEKGTILPSASIIVYQVNDEKIAKDF